MELSKKNEVTLVARGKIGQSVPVPQSDRATASYSIHLRKPRHNKCRVDNIGDFFDRHPMIARDLVDSVRVLYFLEAELGPKSYNSISIDINASSLMG